MANVIFKRGTKAKFEALESKQRNTLYWLEDVQEVWMGDVLFGVGREASAELAGLLSVEDKLKLDALVSGTFNLISADSSMTVEEIDDGKSIKINISALDGNAISLESDGLFVPVQAEVIIPEFSIERQATATAGYSASYRLKRTQGDDVSYVGDTINIPVVTSSGTSSGTSSETVVSLQSGSIEVVIMADAPYEGAEIGDPYIDLLLNDGSHIYIPAKDLVDTYVAGSGIEINDNTVSIKLNESFANGLAVSSDGLMLALASDETAGAMSVEDKQKLDQLSINGILSNLIPVDGSIVITANDVGESIGVAVSSNEGNILTIVDDGLYVAQSVIPSYAAEKQSVAEDGYCTSYKIRQVVGDEVSYVGDTINVPRDLIVQSGTVEKVTEENSPYEGAAVGDSYLSIVLNEPEGKCIYVPVKDLIDTSSLVTQEELEEVEESLTWSDM